MGKIIPTSSEPKASFKILTPPGTSQMCVLGMIGRAMNFIYAVVHFRNVNALLMWGGLKESESPPEIALEIFAEQTL